MKKWLSLFAIFYLLSISAVHSQSSLIDSLKVVVLTSEDDTVKVQNLILLSENLAGTDNKNAIYYASRARNLAVTLDYQPGRAKALKWIGIGYYFQGDYVETTNYWEEALTVFEELGDNAGIANILSNLGGMNADEGDDTRALEYFLRSLPIAEASADPKQIGTVLLNIGFVYSKKAETYNKALEYYSRALPLFEQLNYKDGIATVSLNIGELFFLGEKYDSAQIYFEKSLIAAEGTEIEPSSLNYLGRVYARKGEFNKALSNQQQALEFSRSHDLKYNEAKSLLGMAETNQLQGRHRSALALYEEAIPLLKGQADLKNELRDAYLGLAQSSEEIADFRRALKYQKLLTEIKDTLFIVANQKKLDLLVSNYQNVQNQIEIDLLTKDQALQAANLQKQKIVRNAFFGGFVVIFIIAFIIYRNYRNKVKTNKLLDKQNEQIEGLLLNILPEKVAYELQHDGYATPRDYESATILFTDFKGFTKISSGLLPHELIAELNSYFNEFDDIIGTYNLEKIKTIGDAYMCAGGIPTVNDTHPADAVQAGLAIQEYIKNKNIKRIENGQTPWELRVGIHTGHIVAGVVGSKKYAYDIWGDAVNIASRMESNGEAGKVNISDATYQLVKDKFTCKDRGKISVKGAGEKNMYFVEGVKKENSEIASSPQLSADVLN